MDSTHHRGSGRSRVSGCRGQQAEQAQAEQAQVQFLADQQQAEQAQAEQAQVQFLADQQLADQQQAEQAQEQQLADQQQAEQAQAEQVQAQQLADQQQAEQLDAGQQEQQQQVPLVEPAGPGVWEELAQELETTPVINLANWTVPGKWRSAKPQAYKLIFGERTLPDINRPGNIRMTLGHIVEKATGGTHSLDNLMPQLNAVNVRLSGIYGRKPFALPLPNGEMKVIEAINGKAINGSLRGAFESGTFSLDEQRAISYFVTSMVITPKLERELTDLIKRIPNLESLIH